MPPETAHRGGFTRRVDRIAARPVICAIIAAGSLLGQPVLLELPPPPDPPEEATTTSELGETPPEPDQLFLVQTFSGPVPAVVNDVAPPSDLVVAVLADSLTEVDFPYLENTLRALEKSIGRNSHCDGLTSRPVRSKSNSSSDSDRNSPPCCGNGHRISKAATARSTPPRSTRHWAKPRLIWDQRGVPLWWSAAFRPFPTKYASSSRPTSPSAFVRRDYASVSYRSTFRNTFE